VKEAIINQTLEKLLAAEGLEPLSNYLSDEDDRTYRLDEEIVTEQIRNTCRAVNHEST